MKTHYHRYLEAFIVLLILYSISMHVVEIEFTDAQHSTGYFLWSERVVAILFTIEYFGRWAASRSILYPFRLMAIIDLLAILPFYLGFMVDLRSLRVIRAARILRLFKLYRYTTAMESISNAIYRTRYEFGIIGFAVLSLGWLAAVAIYELEHAAQPEVFAKLSDAAWFVLVTITTVGYGDKVPVTPGGRLATSLVMIGGLALFGTFVSLLGSSFVEELRKSRSLRAARVGESSRPLHELVAAVTPENFNPHDVLLMIGNGSHSGDSISHGDAVRLLIVACQRLLIGTVPPEQKPS